MDASRALVSFQQPLESIVSVADLPTRYRNEIDKGISTGWKPLDKLLQGLRMGEMTVITADTGVGKTTFATHLMVNCALQEHMTWINSWEMKPEVILRKIASIVLRKPMRMQEFTREDSKDFDKWLEKYPMYVNPKTIGTDIDSLAQDLVRAREFGVRVVVLDHLDYLVNAKGDKKQHEAIEETVRRLHEMSFDLGMHIILICHPRQSFGTEEIGIHMLKGSSSIKQYADNIILLHRCVRTDSSAYINKVKVTIGKNRMFGIEGSTYMYYEPRWDGYTELHDEG